MPRPHVQTVSHRQNKRVADGAPTSLVVHTRSRPWATRLGITQAGFDTGHAVYFTQGTEDATPDRTTAKK
jgi:hypothetical protein